MNHYLPPQARTQAAMPYLNEQPRMTVWNPPSVTTVHRGPPSTFYTRRTTTPMQTQTASNAPSWRVISPPGAASPSTLFSNGSKSSPSSGHSAPSVKHLTCYFWAKNGVCKWSNEECLYAHHDTGKVANGPLQVEPGRPAVAGKNATNARPVYEDWRGGLEHSHNPIMSSRKTIEPNIQAQIDYISAKARGAGIDRNPRAGLSARLRRVSEVLTPGMGNGQIHVKNTASSLADSRLEKSMQALGRSVAAMSSILQQSQNTFGHVKEELHQIGCGVLGLARWLETDHSQHADRVTHLAEEIIAIMSEVSRLEASIRETKESVTKDLNTFGLASMVPEWKKASTQAAER